MSEDAFAVYTKARADQAVKNEARHIRTKINEARGSPQDAAVRWPFELLQNALDAGPRAGRESVKVGFTHQDGVFVFEHDGAFFQVQELAALLSGGSSKEFEAAATTGRFGTGFLVTHVLAPSVRLEGLLVARERVEQFNLLLDRAGDEEAIVQNIEQCNEAIKGAHPVDGLDEIPSARFIYDDDDVASLRDGIEAFKRALAYLFMTCPRLGRVRLRLANQTCETWEAGDLTETRRSNAVVKERTVKVSERGLDLRVVSVTSPEGATSALVALERATAGWRVMLPGIGFPRVFCRYPIRTSHFLPVNVVLDARFDVDQERRKVLLGKEEAKTLFRAALTTVVPLVELACEERWELRHHLALVAPSPGSFSDEGTEREWLNAELTALATCFARRNVVETPYGSGPAIRRADGDDGDWCAHFIVPRLSKKSDSDETTIDRVWSLVADAVNLYPPRAELAQDWSNIALGWERLGIEVNLVTLEDLAQEVRGEATHIDGLQVRCDPREWLARFVDAVGECWRRRDVVTKGLFDGLLPDQRGRLASASELRCEKNIPEELKDIAEALGVDVRACLVDRQLMEMLSRAEFAHGAYALTEVVRESQTEEDVVRICVEHLKKTLPEGGGIQDKAQPIVAASIRLLDFLWRTREEAGAQWAKEMPLATRDGKSIRASNQRVIAPVAAWNSVARPFADIYPPNRVLADEYCGNDVGLPSVVAALVGWGMAYAEPLVRQSIGGAELKGDRLKNVLAASVELDGLLLSQAEYSQIALLHEVLPRCAESPELAASLLGLVLAYVAPNDPEWQTTRAIAARRGQESSKVDIRPALWLADVRTRTWVPVQGDGGRRLVQPDVHALRPLLRHEWLGQNEPAIRLLAEFFGFDALELCLVSVSPDEIVQRKIREDLARVVNLLGADAEQYGQLVSQLETRERWQQQRERFLNLGRAVQDAVAKTLSAIGLNVRLVDRGYDFEVSYSNVGDASYQFEVETFLVEVKATTTDRVRMTPKQASTAASCTDRYVLCVVDLRGLPEERLGQPWSTDDVMQLAKLTIDVGNNVRPTWQLIEQARGGTVRISGDESLRYEVPADIWESGCSIRYWVQSTWGKETT